MFDDGNVVFDNVMDSVVSGGGVGGGGGNVVVAARLRANVPAKVVVATTIAKCDLKVKESGERKLLLRRCFQLFGATQPILDCTLKGKIVKIRRKRGREREREKASNQVRSHVLFSSPFAGHKRCFLFRCLFLSDAKMVQYETRQKVKGQRQREQEKKASEFGFLFVK